MKAIVKTVVEFEVDTTWVGLPLNRDRVAELLRHQLVKIKSGKLENAMYGTIVAVVDVQFGD